MYGLDPQKIVIDFARKNRPFLTVKEGYFGPPENDVECDLLVFFQSITRVPYEDRLFEAISRCAKKYVLISWVEDSCTMFNRDFHVGLAKQGLMCIEKKVVNEEFKPYGTKGTKGADGPMIVISEKGQRVPNFTSYFLFRRIEPRD